MITHNDQIAQLADRVIRIEDGKLFDVQITGGDWS
jgi:putative ABC transport system ATP-binding protein